MSYVLDTKLQCKLRGRLWYFTHEMEDIAQWLWFLQDVWKNLQPDFLQNCKVLYISIYKSLLAESWLAKITQPASGAAVSFCKSVINIWHFRTSWISHSNNLETRLIWISGRVAFLHKVTAQTTVEVLSNSSWTSKKLWWICQLNPLTRLYASQSSKWVFWWRGVKSRINKFSARFH